MDIIKTLQSNWGVLVDAPWAFVTIAAVFAVSGFWFGRYFHGERIAILESRLVARDEKIKNLEQLPDAGQKIDASQQHLLGKIQGNYTATHKDLPPRIQAGLELPPAEWINGELAKLEENWRVKNVRGNDCEIYYPAVWG